MEQYTEDVLKSNKVVELKEIAEAFGLETSGLRKAEIISAILEYQNAQIVESEEVDINMQVTATTSDDNIEEIEEASRPQDSIPYQLNLPKSTILYKDVDCKFPKSPVVGLAKVLETYKSSYKVSVCVSGRGYITGYLRR